MRIQFVLLLVVAAALLGAGVTWMFTNRYNVFAAGGGVVMKADRWTGQSWVRRMGFGGSGDTHYKWEEVRE